MKKQLIPKKRCKLYLFYRVGMFYPIELYDDKDAIQQAKNNPGTIKVTDLNGKIIWTLQ